jgi:hypothetical protein
VQKETVTGISGRGKEKGEGNGGEEVQSIIYIYIYIHIYMHTYIHMYANSIMKSTKQFENVGRREDG